MSQCRFSLKQTFHLRYFLSSDLRMVSVLCCGATAAPGETPCCAGAKVAHKVTRSARSTYLLSMFCKIKLNSAQGTNQGSSINRILISPTSAAAGRMVWRSAPFTTRIYRVTSRMTAWTLRTRWTCWWLVWHADLYQFNSLTNTMTTGLSLKELWEQQKRKTDQIKYRIWNSIV